MMRWFGPAHPPPFVHEDLQRVAVPVEQSCAWCDEPVLESEYGFTIPHVDGNSDGTFSVSDRPYHHECFARQLFGSVAHQVGTCTCANPESPHHDPPGLTRRQAARAALFLVEQKRKKQT